MRLNGARTVADTSRTKPRTTDAPKPPRHDAAAMRRLVEGRHHDPHSVLGAHPATVDGQQGLVVRAMHPAAIAAELLVDGGSHQMSHDQGVFGAFVPGAKLPLRYRVRFHFADRNVWERDDPYRFAPTIGDVDLHLFNEGTHRRLWEKLGAHAITWDGVPGVAFAVWAPTAQRV